MKQRMRRISALLLVVLMCVSMVVPAFAADSAECPAVHTKSNCKYGEPIATVEADCGKQGYTVYQCEDCGTYFAADIVESLGDHEYSILMQDPTCTEAGFTKVVCYNCDEVLYETVVPALNHKNEDGTSAMEGPCDAQECSICGYVGEAGDNGHNWGEPELVKVPAHSENDKGVISTTPGSAKVTCLDCGKTKTVPVSCLAEHTWVEYKEVPATCTTTGTTAGKKCSGCGKTAKLDGQNTDPFATIDKVECEADETPVIKAPTCEEAGSLYFPCTMCKEPVDDVITIAPLGHNFQTKIYVLDEEGLTPVELVIYEAYAVLGYGPAEDQAEEDYLALFYDYEITVLVEGEDGELTEESISVEDALAMIGRTGFEQYVLSADKYVWTGDYLTVPSSIEWAKDCTSEQTIYNYNCTRCGGGLPATQLPTGHIWEYVDTVEPDCANGTNGKEIYVCVNPNCSGKGAADKDSTSVTYEEDQEGAAIKNVILEANHNYEVKEVKPTCKKQGYKYEVCTGCKTEKQTNDDKTTRELLDGHYAYDIVDPDTENGHVLVDKIKTAPTCTTTGKKDIVCSEEGCTYRSEVDVVIPATGHNYDPKSTPDLGKTAATCIKGEVWSWTCKTCGQTASEERGNAKGHSWVTKVSAPSCVGEKDGFTVSVCNNCNTPNPENPGQTNIVKFDKTNPDHHDSIRVIERVEGDCVTKDLVYYACDACKDPITKDTFTFEAYDEETGTGHDFEDVEEVPASCVNDGTKAYKHCKVCDLKTLDGTKAATATDLKIAKLTEDGKHNVKSLTYVAAVAPTCTTDGNYAGYKCNDCGAFASEDGLEDDNADKVIKKYDHKINGKESAYALDLTYKFNTRAADCEKWGYYFLECQLCGDEQIVNYVSDFGGHTLSEEVEEVEATCVATGVKAHKYCTVIGCGFLTIDGKTGVTAADLVIDKVAHVNADEEEFWGICTEAEDEEFDFTCTVCGEVTPKCEYAVTKVPATCQDYSYELWVCVHCEDHFVTNKGFTYSDNHVAWGEWVVEEPATTTEAGLKVRVCACGAKEEVEIPALNGIVFSFEIDNATVAGADLTNSGLVALTIKTEASNLDVWGIRLTVEYSSNLSNAMKFDKANSKFADIQVAFNDTDGVATIVAYANVDKTANITLDGEEALVTLYFRVDADAKIGDDVWVEPGEILEVVDKDNNLIDTAYEVTFEDDDDVYYDVYLWVEAILGYVTVDSRITIDDAKEMMFYITGEAAEEYCSAADIDLDGEVTVADFALMQKRLLGVKNDADLAVAYKGETTTTPAA